MRFPLGRVSENEALQNWLHLSQLRLLADIGMSCIPRTQCGVFLSGANLLWKSASLKNILHSNAASLLRTPSSFWYSARQASRPRRRRSQDKFFASCKNKFLGGLCESHLLTTHSILSLPGEDVVMLGWNRSRLTKNIIGKCLGSSATTRQFLKES